MWTFIIGSLMTAVFLGLCYLSVRSACHPMLLRLTGGRKWLARLLCLFLYLLLTGILWQILGMMNACICVVHLMVFRLLCDLAGHIISKIRHKKTASCWTEAVAWLLCIVYLFIGWIAAHDVRATAYHFDSDKLSQPLRIVQIADSHIGATFDAEGFSAYIDEINALSPDAVVITGDYIDDDTTAEDLAGACEALGRLQTTYGVYFAYGNHDMGYAAESIREWNDASLRQALTENGVVILEDEAVLLGDSFYIVGRKDRSVVSRGSSRQTADQLLSELDLSKYIIMLDHQPADYEAQAAAGVDLVLSGHTHGGQFFPFQYAGEWTGEYYLRYGHERRQNTDFVVTSGISNWTFRFKTGCFSEYVVIDIQ